MWRKEKRSLESMLGRPRSLLSGGLLFPILLDVLEDLIREVKLPVYVAGIWIIRVRADGELLLLLPLGPRAAEADRILTFSS